jgi:putative tryptophan/tyrosine transport system substrate-binding protein
MDKVDGAVERVLAEKPDLIVSFTTPVTLKVKKATKGTDIPVLFAPVVAPVRSGLVKSLKEPGGRFTGIQDRGAGAKGLAWVARIVPGLQRIYVPFKPDDKAMGLNMRVLKRAAADRRIDSERDFSGHSPCGAGRVFFNHQPENGQCYRH